MYARTKSPFENLVLGQMDPTNFSKFTNGDRYPLGTPYYDVTASTMTSLPHTISTGTPYYDVTTPTIPTGAP